MILSRFTMNSQTHPITKFDHSIILSAHHARLHASTLSSCCFCTWRRAAPSSRHLSLPYLYQSYTNQCHSHCTAPLYRIFNGVAMMLRHHSAHSPQELDAGRGTRRNDIKSLCDSPKLSELRKRHLITFLDALRCAAVAYFTHLILLSYSLTFSHQNWSFTRFCDLPPTCTVL